ncbi:hypothetical protein GPNCGGLF_LOCUS522 [Methylorubrum aminovorans]
MHFLISIGGLLGVRKGEFVGWSAVRLLGRETYCATPSLYGLARPHGRGVAFGLPRIEWIMRENAMRARPRRRGRMPKEEGVQAAAAANFLERPFAAASPNRK